MRTLIHSALRYLVNKLTSSSGLKLNKRALELLLSSRPPDLNIVGLNDELVLDLNL